MASFSASIPAAHSRHPQLKPQATVDSSLRANRFSADDNPLFAGELGEIIFIRRQRFADIRTCRINSACASDSRLRRMPLRLQSHPCDSRRPAVSMNTTGRPRMLAVSSIVTARGCREYAETMARSRPRKLIEQAGLARVWTTDNRQPGCPDAGSDLHPPCADSSSMKATAIF